MKKILASVLAVSLLMCAAGCSESAASDGNETATTTAPQQTTDETTATTTLAEATEPATVTERVEDGAFGDYIIYEKDENGNIITESHYTDEDILTLYSELDENGRSIHDIHYTYAGEYSCEYITEYDENGNNTRTEYIDADETKNKVTERKYDENGVEIERVDYDCTGAETYKRTSVYNAEYDCFFYKIYTNGILSREDLPSTEREGYVDSISYFENGQIREVYSNPLVLEEGKLTYFTCYDESGNVIDQGSYDESMAP